MPDLLEPPASPINVTIPSLKAGKAPSTPPKEQKPAETPPPAQKLPESPPAAKIEAADTSEIPTQIVGGAKSNAQFANERRKAKLDRAAEQLGVPKLNEEVEQSRAQYLEMKLKAERLESDRAADLERMGELQRLAEDHKAQLDSRENDYFERHQARFDPLDDEELRTSEASVRSILSANMPIRVPGPEGDKRAVKFEDVMANPTSAHWAYVALNDFIAARAVNNEVGMDRAVNLMAVQLGADVAFSDRPGENRLLESSDPAFVAIEKAMVLSIDPLLKKKGREAFISEQAPVLIQKQIREREASIATNLRKGIFLDTDTRASIAAQNPMDGRVILGAVLEASPQLRDEADRYISMMAPATARVGEIRMPTLTSKDPKDIQAHRAEAARYQRQLGEMTTNAVIGHLSTFIIGEMAGELEALRLRVGDISSAQNPGGTRHSDDAGSTADQKDTSGIPTKIVGGGRNNTGR